MRVSPFLYILSQYYYIYTGYFLGPHCGPKGGSTFSRVEIVFQWWFLFDHLIYTNLGGLLGRVPKVEVAGFFAGGGRLQGEKRKESWVDSEHFRRSKCSLLVEKDGGGDFRDTT